MRDGRAQRLARATRRRRVPPGLARRVPRRPQHLVRRRPPIPDRPRAPGDRPARHHRPRSTCCPTGSSRPGGGGRRSWPPATRSATTPPGTPAAPTSPGAATTPSRTSPSTTWPARSPTPTPGSPTCSASSPAPSPIPAATPSSGAGVHTQSYVPLVAERFLAGRTFNDVAINSPLHGDLAQVERHEQRRAHLRAAPPDARDHRRRRRVAGARGPRDRAPRQRGDHDAGHPRRRRRVVPLPRRVDRLGRQRGQPGPQPAARSSTRRALRNRRRPAPAPASRTRRSLRVRGRSGRSKVRPCPMRHRPAPPDAGPLGGSGGSSCSAPWWAASPRSGPGRWPVTSACSTSATAPVRPDPLMTGRRDRCH